MNVLRNFTLKNIKLNKRRSFVTIIGIILSTALICTVAGMFSSFQKTMVNAIIKDTGNYHVMFNNVDVSDIKYIKNNRKVDKYYLENTLGFIEVNLKDCNNCKEYTYIKSYDDNSLENIKLKKGRLPKNSSEIIISNSINKQTNYKINDQVSLDIYKNSSNNNYIYDDDGNISLKLDSSGNYKIVGIIDPEYNYDDFLIINKLDKISSKADIKVKYKNIHDTYKITKELNEKNYEVNYNSELLRWSLVSSTDNTKKTLYTLVLVVIGIIVLSSIFVIRNSFAISTTEKMRQFGMLSSIGATKKQIRKSVLYEGFILGLIGIPSGILLGVVVIYILVIFSNNMLGEMLNNISFVINIPVSAIVISILLGGVTIFLSSIASAYRASRVSPIEAIRSNNEIKIKSHKLKTPKIIKKLFKVGGEIAYKNLKRNKKKYRTTIISLVVSITIFISLSTFIHYGFSVSNIYYKELPYNISVRDRADRDKTYENYSKIIKLDNIDSYSIKRNTNFETDRKYLVDDIMYGDDERINITLLSIGEENYKKYIKSLNLNYEDVKDKIIFVENTSYMYENQIVKTFDLKEHDKIEGIIRDKKQTLEIAKVTKKGGYGIDNYAYGSGAFIISDYLIEKLGVGYVNNLEINSSDSYKLEEDIKKLNIDTINVENIDFLQKQMNNMTLWISVFLYGFIIVISLIGVTNIFNTITTNMNLRSKEFAMLKSIGMTKREFNYMIRFESILYGLKSLLIGCTLGIMFSYLIYKGLSNSIDFGFDLPIKAIIISIIFILLVVGLIMKYSLSKINKQNIIETIRKDNI